MSSVQSAFAQVGPREKYLVATGAASAVTVDNGKVVTSSMTLTDFNDATTTASPAVASGDLFFDLGKTVTLYDPDTLLSVAKYQKVALVNGAGTQGNNADVTTDLYVRVWDDAGTAPALARLG
jgi:hypothetical protein